MDEEEQIQIKDDFLITVRNHQRREDREYCHPYEHLGIGDRLIYNRVIRDIAKLFRDSREDKLILATKARDYVIAVEMQRYGFRPRESRLDFEV